jgi:ERCC4-type nuclease
MKNIKHKEIYSIFSKKPLKKENNTPEKIIIDYREKNSLVPSYLKKQGLEIEFKELKIADYIIKETAIERKTVEDFKISMLNKRLLNQLQEINQYEKKLLIIEGIEEKELYSERNLSGIHPNSIRGFLLSILLKYKVPILFTKNQEDTAKFIYLISKKQKKEISLRTNKKTLDTEERLQYILEGFPGIGPKNAKNLLKKFKTLKNILNASEQELKEILGKKSESFFKIIQEEYSK